MPRPPVATSRWAAVQARLGVLTAPPTQSPPLLLRDKEAALADLWVERLRAIMVAAGEAATMAATLREAGLSEELVLKACTAAAWRTLRGHVRHWERFAAWAGSEGVFPPSARTVLRFLQDLSSSHTAQSVGGFLASLKWVSSKIGLAFPALPSEVVGAVFAQAKAPAAEAREAVALDLGVVRALEVLVGEWVAQAPGKAILAWQVLCMTFASMRYDDALHVRPSSLELCEGGGVLKLQAWRTKTERQRATKVVVVGAGFSGSAWLQQGYACWAERCGEALSVDFWLFDTTPLRPLSYQAFTARVRGLLGEAYDRMVADGEPDTDGVALQTVQAFSAHSPRCTLVSALAHHGASPPVLQLQGRWKDPAMPAKYTRERGLLPLGAIASLAADVRRGWRPAAISPPRPEEPKQAEDVAIEDQQEEGEESASDLEDDPLLISFWEPGPGTNVQRVHVLSLKDATLMACGSVGIAQCVPAEAAPPLSLVCGNCLRARPDAALSALP